MKVFYKYQIGQEVVFNGMPNNKLSWGRDKYLEKIKGKKVTIISRGFIFEDTGYFKRKKQDETFELKIFYYIKEDPWITEGNPNDTMTCISEECLDGIAHYEEVDEKFITHDGVDIEVANTKVYDRLLAHSSKDVITVNTRFSFTNFGTVMGIRKNYEMSLSTLKNTEAKGFECNKKEIKISREFLCYFKPTEEELESGKLRYRQDAAALDYESWSSLSWTNETGDYFSPVVVNVPENFPELFVQSALFSTGFYSVFDGSKATFLDDWEVREWLNFLGVLEQTEKLYYEKLPEQFKKIRQEKIEERKFTDKVKEELLKLTPKQLEIIEIVVSGITRRVIK
jgi:hypothetical protein